MMACRYGGKEISAGEISFSGMLKVCLASSCLLLIAISMVWKTAAFHSAVMPPLFSALGQD